MNYLNAYMKGRNNNLDAMRFLIATWVLYVHSFPLSGHGQSSESLRVMTFFIISGFFITLSLVKGGNIRTFINARIIRIFPGLIFITLVTVFFIGPLVTKLSIVDYYFNSETLKYFKVFLIRDLEQHTLPGVFDDNPFGNVVNGSLWTIYYEVVFYIGMFILAFLGLVKKRMMLGLFVFSFIVFLSPFTEGKTYFEMFIFFAAGSVFYLYKDKIPVKISYALISFVLLVTSSFTDYFVHTFAFAGTYLVIFLIYYKKINIPYSVQLGNYSYALFLFGFPIQQAVIHFFGGMMSPMLNFLIAFPICLLCAICSWHFVEKHFVKYKKASIFRKSIATDHPVSERNIPAVRDS